MLTCESYTASINWNIPNSQENYKCRIMIPNLIQIRVTFWYWKWLFWRFMRWRSLVSAKNCFDERNNLREIQTTFPEPIEGRSRSVRTQRVTEAVVRNIRQVRGRWQNSWTFQTGGYRRIAKRSLGPKQFTIHRRQLLPCAPKQIRLKIGKEMLLEMQRATDKVLVWSDENSYVVGEGNQQIEWFTTFYQQVIW